MLKLFKRINNLCNHSQWYPRFLRLPSNCQRLMRRSLMSKQELSPLLTSRPLRRKPSLRSKPKRLLKKLLLLPRKKPRPLPKQKLKLRLSRRLSS